MQVIKIYEILQKRHPISTEDGDLIYPLIKKALDEKEPIQLDFENIDMVLTSFVHCTYGKLFGQFSPEFIHQNLSFINHSKHRNLNGNLIDFEVKAIEFYQTLRKQLL